MSLSNSCVVIKMYDDLLEGKPLIKSKIMKYAGTFDEDKFDDYKRNLRYFLILINETSYLLYIPKDDHYELKSISYINKLREDCAPYRADDKNDISKIMGYQKIFRSSKLWPKYLHMQGEISEELVVRLNKDYQVEKYEQKVINNLMFYKILLDNEDVYRDDIMNMFDVSSRTVDNMIAEIRVHLSESRSPFKLVYDAKRKSYKLANIKNKDCKEYKYY